MLTLFPANCAKFWSDDRRRGEKWNKNVVCYFLFEYILNILFVVFSVWYNITIDNKSNGIRSFSSSILDEMEVIKHKRKFSYLYPAGSVPAKATRALWTKVKCYKIKIKPGINRAKSGFIPLGELSTIILLAPSSLCVARKINLSSSPRVIKHHFIARLINSYYLFFMCFFQVFYVSLFFLNIL